MIIVYIIFIAVYLGSALLYIVLTDQIKNIYHEPESKSARTVFSLYIVVGGAFFFPVLIFSSFKFSDFTELWRERQ